MPAWCVVYGSSAFLTYLVRLHLEICLSSQTIQASFVGAVAVADLVKSTLGPKGMVSYNVDC